MNQCEHFSEDHETCTNADSPYCADFCPMWEHKDACLYSSENDLVRRLRNAVIERIVKKWRMH